MQNSIESLAEFNGKESDYSYIAVDGIVYDVTNDKNWKNGEHHGFLAGTDLTAEFNAQHKMATLRKLPKVGVLK